MSNNPSDLKARILELTAEYSRLVHSNSSPEGNSSWQSGDPIPYAARVFSQEEVVAAVSSSLDFWLTLGEHGSNFESNFSSYLGVNKSLLVNSGSSANLLALSALTSHRLPIDKRLLPGDEVITVACGFPTTVAPIVQVGAVPVFIDINPKTFNPLLDSLKLSFAPGKTKAVVFAHALGNPFDLHTVLQFCRDNELWLIEDNCDSLGSTYSLDVHLANRLGFTTNSPGLPETPGYITRYTGTWGDISTQSFYPPHHITTGEGGMVNICSNSLLSRIIESFRDWGRDCWCPSGVDNSYNKRFDWSLGDLPVGYDHKYIYSHLGFNLKPLDIQAAIGSVQLTRLPSFVAQRQKNWNYLRTHLDELSAFLEFSLPTHATSWSPTSGFKWESDHALVSPSWFGFSLSLKDVSHRRPLAQFLDSHKVGNRAFFAGNLIRQPAFTQLKLQKPGAYRVIGSLDNSDYVMNRSLFVGTYPGLTSSMLDHEISLLKSYFSTI